jgi:predicted phage gp36 major capsid-like protein
LNLLLTTGGGRRAHAAKKQVRKAAASLSGQQQSVVDSARRDRTAQRQRYSRSGLAAAAGCFEGLKLTGVPPNPLAVFAAR